MTTYQELLLLLLRRLVVEATGLNDLVVNVELVTRAREHGFFDALLGNEPQNADDLRLTDTMSTVLRLQVSMWVPVTVETRGKARCELWSTSDTSIRLT